MHPIKQTIFGGKEGNCFAACVASILEMQLEDVPNFCAMRLPGSGDWTDYFQQWLGERGLFAFEVNRYGQDKFTLSSMPEGMMLILSGKSPRGDYLHSVVGVTECCSVKPIHDPHPDNTFVDGAYKCILVFAALNPAGIAKSMLALSGSSGV